MGFMHSWNIILKELEANGYDDCTESEVSGVEGWYDV